MKFQDLSDATRLELAAKWTSINGGTFNLYFAFFELGVQLLKPDGILGYITPNNYFTSLAGESLEAVHSERAHLRKVLDFGHRRVFDAQTYTAITFLTKEQQTTVLYDRIRDDQDPDDFLRQHAEHRNVIDQLNPKKWRLLKEEDIDNIRHIERAGIAIGSMFEIVVGIATLKDSVYFVNDYEIDGPYLRISRMDRSIRSKQRSRGRSTRSPRCKARMTSVPIGDASSVHTTLIESLRLPSRKRL
ncbi:MAG: hypothetical protein IPP33_06290 [Flavobacteriales bacterium]|nr:hypothetical protein [Flavobacteriales bacterium]